MKKIIKGIKKIYFIIHDNLIYIIKKIKYSCFKTKKPLCKSGNDKRKPRIIVSITSIPSRFDKLYMCLSNIGDQSVKPDKVILYLGNNNKNLPKEIIELQNRGLTIEYRDDSKLRVHTKYFYAMKEYPNDIIVTFDDDILYNKNVLKNLYESYLKNPNCVSSMRIHKITVDNDGKINKYNNWKWEYAENDAIGYEITITAMADSNGNKAIDYIAQP